MQFTLAGRQVMPSAPGLKRVWMGLGSAMLAIALLGGCSSSSSDDAADPAAEEPTVLSGLFLGGPVEGLDYTTETQSGTTDADGTFTYLEDETVTFTIGDFAFGEAAGAPILTTWDLNGSETDIRGFLSRQHLLANLDDDADPSTGIVISDTYRDSLQGQTFDFAGDEDVSELLDAVSIPEGFSNYSVESNNNALYHFGLSFEQIAEIDPVTLIPEQGEGDLGDFVDGGGAPNTLELASVLDVDSIVEDVEDTVTAPNVLMFLLTDPTEPSDRELVISDEGDNVFRLYHTPSLGEANPWLLIFTTRITVNGVPLPTAFMWFFIGGPMG